MLMYKSGGLGITNSPANPTVNFKGSRKHNSAAFLGGNLAPSGCEAKPEHTKSWGKPGLSFFEENF